MDQGFDPTQVEPGGLDTDPSPSDWDAFTKPEHDPSLDDAWMTVSSGQSVLLVDENYDGAWNHVAIDLDGDGLANLIVSPNGVNYVVAVDTNNDGQFDHAEIVTRDELAVEAPQVLDYLDTSSIQLDISSVDVQQVGPDAIVTTTDVSEYWFQQAVNGFCVPASIAQIISSYTGIPFEDEAAFVDLANQFGLWTVGLDGVPGITMNDALLLFEATGVPATLMYSSNLDILESFLDAGHGIMLAVDSTQMYTGMEGVVDHALVILDIDRDAGIVVLSDPGLPEGNGLIVDLDVFESSWAQGDNAMLVAEQPAPHPASIPSSELVTTSAISGPSAELPALLTERLSDPATKLESVMSWVTQNPWVILPVAVAASRIRPA